MSIRIHGINQMARGCKITFDPGGPAALYYLYKSVALKGWGADSMGWVEGTDLVMVLVEGAKKSQLTEHLKGDPEFDFSKYK